MNTSAPRRIHEARPLRITDTSIELETGDLLKTRPETRGPVHAVVGSLRPIRTPRKEIMSSELFGFIEVFGQIIQYVVTSLFAGSSGG